MTTRKTWQFWLYLTLGSLLLMQSASSTEPNSEPVNSPAQEKINLPYAFSNATFGASIGYIYGVAGYPQEQSMIFGTAMAGTTGSGMVLLMARDIIVFGIKRLYVDPILSVGYFGEFDTYTDGNPDFPNQRAGSNASHLDNNIQGKGWDNSLRLRFNFLLPIGYGRNHVTKDYKLHRGLLKSGASGGESLNPFKSGKTSLEVSPFFRNITIESDDISDTDIKTNGVDIALNWDNRDYPDNPSRGHGLDVKVSRDFGWLESNKSWTAYLAEFDKYVSLGSNGWLRQTVIAFDFWTAYSPTWEVSASGDITNNPPPFAGASLGGYWRMRGYPPQRFNDKAAIYYALELRLIPKWNPFEGWSWLHKRLGVQWVQFVPFFEIGRVAPEWDWNELHENMKWDAGLGLRCSAKGMVLRIDTAVSEEDYGVQMMVAQPFQF